MFDIDHTVWSFYYTNVFQQSKVSVQITGKECNDVTQWLMTCQESICNKA